MGLVIGGVEVLAVPASVSRSVVDKAVARRCHLRWVKNVAADTTRARCRREAFGIESVYVSIVHGYNDN